MGEQHAPRGSWRRAVERLTSSQEDLEASELQVTAEKLGGTPVSELPDRQPACVCGTLKAVTLRPRAGVPALVAELYDGTGVLTLVWLGRRQIAGIEPGRKLRVRGRVTQKDGGRVVFNPSYELIAQ